MVEEHIFLTTDVLATNLGSGIGIGFVASVTIGLFALLIKKLMQFMLRG